MKLKASPAFSLLMARVAMVVLFLPWALDKFIKPEHANKVFENFYAMSLDANLGFILGGLQVLLIVVFALGILKNISYLLVLILHTVSIASTYDKLLNPFDGNLLFVAGAALWFVMLGLYLCRDQDTLLTVNVSKG